jgi:flagella basal body P-ring formation protein FlgA
VYAKYLRLIMMVLILVLCSYAFASGCAQPRINIRLHESVCVYGDEVRLIDLAEISIPDTSSHALELEELAICGVPQPGGMRTVNSRYVQTRLYQAGLRQGSFELSGADTVLVYVPHRVVSVDSFKKALDRAIYERLGEQGIAASDVLIEVVSTLFEMSLPKGSVDFSFDIPPALRSGAYNAIKSSIFVDGELYSSKMVMVRIRVFQDVLVAKRRISMHEVLSEQDFSRERLEAPSGMSSPSVWEIPSCTVRASRTILKGRILTRDLVEAIPDAFCDDTVTIRVSIGNISVETTGTLTSDARIGERVSVRNADTNSVVFGILMERDTVCIEI